MPLVATAVRMAADASDVPAAVNAHLEVLPMEAGNISATAVAAGTISLKKVMALLVSAKNLHAPEIDQKR